MFAALFSLRHEIYFLKTTKVGRFGWTISILNFLVVLCLIIVLLSHHLFPQPHVLLVVVTLLILLLIISAIQLISRRRIFIKLQRELRQSKKDLILEARDLIDEKKREKIRENYKKEKEEN